jgi:predicted CoA-binding protein
MKDEEIKDLLRNVKNVAVVGISPKEDRPSYVVASYLKSKGYRIIPVRPDGDEILGEKVYHSLSENRKTSHPLLKRPSSGEPGWSGCRKASFTNRPAK